MHVHQIYFVFDGETRRVGRDDEVRLRAIVTSMLPADRPDAEYTLWTLESAERLVRQEYPLFAPIMELRRSAFPIVLCDFFRYLLMYHFGGIYLDLDFVPIRPLGALFDEVEAGRVAHTPANATPSVLLCEEWHESYTMSETLHNGILHSRAPRHPFWWDVLWRVYREVVVRATPIRSAQDVYALSGPKMLRERAHAARTVFRDVAFLPYYVACPYVAVSRIDPKDRVLCNGMDAVPSIQESNWVFLGIEDVATLCRTCPRSYYANLSLPIGSMWKRDSV